RDHLVALHAQTEVQDVDDVDLIVDHKDFYLRHPSHLPNCVIKGCIGRSCCFWSTNEVGNTRNGKELYENLHDLRIELRARAPFELSHRLLVAHRMAVRPPHGHRLVRVHDRDDPRAHRDLLPDETARVAASVHTLVVRHDDVGH